MAFTVAELASIANSALDYHYRGQPFAQTIQDKPLLNLLNSNRKTFPGGKGDITIPVKGNFSFEDTDNPNPRPGTLTGYTHNDAVKYGEFAQIERAKYTWRELHTGWKVTYTELKMDGISVSDSTTGEGERRHSKREMTAISNILEDKLTTFSEVNEREMNTMLWGTGAGDNLGLVGIRHFITATPSTGTTGGFNRANYAWWRNRYLSVNVTGSAEVIPAIHTEMRQLRRYGGKPTRALCGSGFIDQVIKELRAKGSYTDMGWAAAGATNIGIGDVKYNNLKFEYDPSLDDLSLSSNCYLIDPTKLHMQVMDGEWGRDHMPARPHDEYVLYRARTYTGQLVCSQLNAHGLITFA